MIIPKRIKDATSLQNSEINKGIRSLTGSACFPSLIQNPELKESATIRADLAEGHSHGRPYRHFHAECPAPASPGSLLGEELRAFGGPHDRPPRADARAGRQGLQRADRGGRERGGGLHLPALPAGGDEGRPAPGDQASPAAREYQGQEDPQGPRGRPPQPPQAYDG